MPDPTQLQTNEATAQLSLTAGNQYVWRVGYYDEGNLTFTDWSSEFTAVSAMNGTIQSGQDIDIGTGKILYSNVYQTLADLPDAASYHGMFAHVHAEAAAYYAHAGNWVKLADDADVPTSYVSGLNGLAGSVTLAGGQNVQVSQLGNQLTISATQALTSLNGESGALSLVGGSGILVNTADNVITLNAIDHTSVNSLTGNLSLVGGDGIFVSTNGQNLVVSSEGVSWSTPPAAPSSAGDPGDVAYDNDFLYVRTSSEWRRTALSTWAPTITIELQPQNMTLADGGSGNFAIAATVSDGSNATYQWQNSDDSGATWDTITGSTGTTYSLSGVSTLDNGTQYRAIVSAAGASDVTSSVATLTIGAVATDDLLAENGDRLMTEGGDSLDHDGTGGGGGSSGSGITFTSHPQSIAGDRTAGSAVSFYSGVSYSGSGSVSYQWYYIEEGVTTAITQVDYSWSSPTSSSYRRNVQACDAYRQFFVRVTDSVSGLYVDSNTATFTGQINQGTLTGVSNSYVTNVYTSNSSGIWGVYLNGTPGATYLATIQYSTATSPQESDWSDLGSGQAVADSNGLISFSATASSPGGNGKYRVVLYTQDASIPTGCDGISAVFKSAYATVSFYSV